MNGDIVFPESFVKLDARPRCPYMAVGDENGGRIVTVPGDVRFTQHDITLSELDKFCQMSGDCSAAHIRLYDSCGPLIEEWKLVNAQLKCLTAEEYAPYTCDAEWEIKYEEAKYDNYRDVFTGATGWMLRNAVLEALVSHHGEQYRTLIQDALDWLEAKEDNWGLSEPLDRESFIADLVARTRLSDQS